LLSSIPSSMPRIPEGAAVCACSWMPPSMPASAPGSCPCWLCARPMAPMTRGASIMSSLPAVPASNPVAWASPFEALPRLPPRMWLRMPSPELVSP